MYVIFYESNIQTENSEDLMDDQIIIEAFSKQIDIEDHTKHEEENTSHPKELQVNKNHPLEQVIGDLQKGVSICSSLRNACVSLFFSNCTSMKLKR